MPALANVLVQVEVGNAARAGGPQRSSTGTTAADDMTRRHDRSHVTCRVVNR